MPRIEVINQCNFWGGVLEFACSNVQKSHR